MNPRRLHNGRRDIIEEATENNFFKLITRGITAIGLPLLLAAIIGMWNSLSDNQKVTNTLVTQVAVLQHTVEEASKDRYTNTDQLRYAELVNLRFSTLEHRIEQIERGFAVPRMQVQPDPRPRPHG